MISVHLTTHRRFRTGTLQTAMDSILGQTFGDFELIVCDDASTDGTASYLESVAGADARVRVIHNERNVNNVAIAFGRCFEAADPARPLVTWMFDDCVLKPNALERLAHAMEADDGLDLAFGTTAVQNRDRRPARMVGADDGDAIRANIDRQSVLVPNAGIVVRRRLFDAIGWYDPNVLLRRSCDWDLFRRAILGGARFAVLGGEIVCEEWGELLPDSLRNSFTADFDLMYAYVTLRDEAGWDLSLDAALHHPIDRIPFGPWTAEQYRLCTYVMLEYFLSIHDLPRAAVWARRLASQLGQVPFYADTLDERGGDDPSALGAYCGVVWGAYWAARSAGEGGAPAAARNGHRDPAAVLRVAQALAARPRIYPAARWAWRAVRPLVRGRSQ